MGKTGVILVNTGSPAEPTAEAVGSYLSAFLMDPRLVSVPRPLWWYILHFKIIPRRSEVSAEKYRRIWTDAGSPLVLAHLAMVRGLGRLLEPASVPVVGAMCYAQPTVREALEQLRSQGCTRIVYVPLYPQSAYTQVGSCTDAFGRACRDLRWNPPVELVADYWDDELYLQAVVDSIRAAGFDPQRDHLDLSYHSIPLRDVRNGDAYVDNVYRTNCILAERLGVLDDTRWATGFQSVFGHRPQDWAAPLSVSLMEDWGRAGVSSVYYCCPGFAADCLETLYDVPYEMEAAYRSTYRSAHPQAPEPSFTYVPCLDPHEVYPAILHHVLQQRSRFLQGE